MQAELRALQRRAARAQRIDRQAAKLGRLMRSWQWRRVWLESLRLRLMQRGLR